MPHKNFIPQFVKMADGGYGPWGRGWDGYGGAPPASGGGYGGGWGYGYGYGGYGGGYRAPLDIGNSNWAETGNNEVHVGNNTPPGSSIGNNNRAGGSNIITVGHNPPGGYGPGGIGVRVHFGVGSGLPLQ